MDRSYASGAAGSAPAAPASPSIGYPTAGNPGTGTPATKPGPYWYHQITEELMAIISAAGITPAQGTLTQLASAIQSGKLFSAAAGGTADVLTASFSPAVASLVNGMSLHVRATSANATATPTFTPNSGTIAAKTIVKGAGSALVAGDIAGGGHWIELQYDSTLGKWVLLNPAKGITAVATALVIRSADYTTSASSPSKITWTTLKQDPLGLWDAANNQFVIQKAGMYDVRSAIHITPGSAVGCYYHALINGSAITGNSKSFSGGTYNGLSVLNFSSRMRLNAGDTLAMYVFGVSLPVTSFSDENHCWFELTYTGEN